MRLLAALATATLIVAACGSRVESGSSASPKPRASLGASASASGRIVAFPDLPFILGTNTGDLFFQLVNGQAAGRKVHACQGAIRELFAYGRRAVFLCGAGHDSTLRLYDDDSGSVTTLVQTEATMAAFDGADRVVFVAIGEDRSPAPIPTTKLLALDLRTGAKAELDDRFGVAFELRTTGEGVAVWRPRNSESFVRPEAEAGTWIVSGTTLSKLSAHRLIDGGKGRDLLESEPMSAYGYASTGSTFVVWRTNDERRLTPADVPDEKGLALLEDGRVVTWRPQNGLFDGTVVIYDPLKGLVLRADRGMFSSFKTQRSGDWLVGLEYSGPPALTLRAYRISDGAFASTPGGGISAIAFLGPKK